MAMTKAEQQQMERQAAMVVRMAEKLKQCRERCATLQRLFEMMCERHNYTDEMVDALRADEASEGKPPLPGA